MLDFSGWNDWCANLSNYSRLTGRVGKRRALKVNGQSALVETLEDRLLLTAVTDGTVANYVTIADSLNGGPNTNSGDLLGGSVTSIGDFDGDGVADLVVGAPQDDTGGTDRGAIHLLFLNADGSVKSSIKIASATGGAPTLHDNSHFGSAVAAMGDLNDDGVIDLAVGAESDDIDGRERGAVFILFLNEDGTVQSSTRIASGENGGPKLQLLNHFGTAIAALGDLDGDGIEDLAVGAPDSIDPNEPGTVYILFLDENGSVNSSEKISGSKFNLTTTFANGFGSALAARGDTNNDGSPELLVGSPRTNPGGGINSGFVYIVELSPQGKATFWDAFGYYDSKFGVQPLQLGSSIASIGDLNGDGVNEFAIGATGNIQEGQTHSEGDIYIFFSGIHFMGSKIQRIGDDSNGGPTLSAGDRFGISIAAIGDLNGDGITELAVGARDDDNIHASNGVLRVLFLAPNNQRPTIAVNGGPVNFTSVSQPVAIASALTLDDSDTDPALQIPGGQLIISFDAASNKKHTKVYDSIDLSGLDSVGSSFSRNFVGSQYRIVFRLSHLATLTEIRDALRTITFSTEKAGLKKATRTIAIQVQDQARGFSEATVRTINVTH